MKPIEVVFLIVYALGMSAGQLLFKLSAGSLAGSGSLKTLLFDFRFLLAVALYGALTIYWVWLLSFIPLTRAYPFVAVSLIATTAAGVLFFGEVMTMRLALGSGLIALGTVLVAGGGSNGLQ
ncbi:hypothetical protein GCM10025771_25810 [Niveibacterium umoris]|uniref:Drug/metabolite transporter (DMT)-like permease n=1 Tax=Niveibacterium umoris TaxID=1193620 RepID=A0A840BFC0_9RHOO|nr:4-amino-4-deoxy-L-arabinose-phospho-UDP flippase [Niveibacterium umoris]MBB4012231.1 drug/metabolite transporter (DMT)-like permease [Niveibacterium umoris]